MAKKNNKNNFGLYIHVPFCEKKCLYCSFYSKKFSGEQDFISWLEYIKFQLCNFELIQREKIFIDTVYIGGGTPSVLSLRIWRELLNLISEYFNFSECREFTIEANPNTLTRDLINFWKNNNVSRISLGVQSLNDSELKFLGRIHDAKQALNAMELIKNSGLNLNADLIFSIPGQNLRSWHNSINGVINSGADHISTYQLTLDENTPLGKILNNRDLNESGYYFYRYAQYFLPKKNFIQYEISNFSRKNFECVHNLKYWYLNNIIALGPYSTGYLNGVRYKNFDNPENIYYEYLTFEERAKEYAILNLRTKFGINKLNFINKFGEKILHEIENKLINFPDDLIYIDENKIILTKRGMRLANYIWSEII